MWNRATCLLGLVLKLASQWHPNLPRKKFSWLSNMWMASLFQWYKKICPLMKVQCLQVVPVLEYFSMYYIRTKSELGLQVYLDLVKVTYHSNNFYVDLFDMEYKGIYPNYSKNWATIDCSMLYKSISFIWIVWSTLYVYLWCLDKKLYRK